MLNVVMGVDERPPNEFADTLKRYMRLIGDDKGESVKAKKLRSDLERLSPHDPGTCHGRFRDSGVASCSPRWVRRSEAHPNPA